MEDLEDVVAAVAIHLALYEQCGAAAPPAALAADLEKKALRLYDEGIDGLEPQGDFKVRRRAIIAETLRRYEAASRRSAPA